MEFFLVFLLCSSARNKNTKMSSFYPLQVTMVLSNFLQLKQLKKVKNIYEYCDPFEL